MNTEQQGHNLTSSSEQRYLVMAHGCFTGAFQHVACAEQPLFPSLRRQEL